MKLMVAVLCTVVLWTYAFPLTDIQHLRDIQPQPDFDLLQFAGEWYRVGMAYESPKFIKFKDRLLISKGALVVNENGGANLTMWTLLGPKMCSLSFYVYDKTDVPGLFTYYSLRHKMEKDITVVEMNHTEYAMVLKYRKMDKEYTQVALYGRTPTLRPELVERFRLYSLSLGFSEESIVVPHVVDPCPISELRPPDSSISTNLNKTVLESHGSSNS